MNEDENIYLNHCRYKTLGEIDAILKRCIKSKSQATSLLNNFEVYLNEIQLSTQNFANQNTNTLKIDQDIKFGLFSVRDQFTLKIISRDDYLTPVHGSYRYSGLNSSYYNHNYLDEEFKMEILYNSKIVSLNSNFKFQIFNVLQNFNDIEILDSNMNKVVFQDRHEFVAILDCLLDTHFFGDKDGETLGFHGFKENILLVDDKHDAASRHNVFYVKNDLGQTLSVHVHLYTGIGAYGGWDNKLWIRAMLPGEWMLRPEYQIISAELLENIPQ